MQFATDLKRVFIIGPGRSGTSLMLSLLDSHREISSLPETQFLRVFVCSRPTKFSSTESMLAKAPRLQRLCDIDLNLTIKEPASALTIYDLIVHEVCRRYNSKVVADKDPRLVEQVDNLFRLYPDSKIICMQRDPGDILLSKQNAEWSGRRHWLLNAYITHFHMILCDRSEARFGHRFKKVKYESLTSNLEDSLRDICGFLELQFDEQMLKHERSAGRLISDDEKSWKANLTKSVFVNSQKWRNELTGGQVILVRSLLSMVSGSSHYNDAYHAFEVKISPPAIIFMRFLARGIHLMALSHILLKDLATRIKLSL